jgi:hypothetical protein
MTVGPFPREPEFRRAILVMREDEVHRCLMESEAARVLIGSETFVLQVPAGQPEHEHPILQRIVQSGLARPGTILLQSPYDFDSYVDAADAAQQFPVEKWFHLSTLCGYLGARKVEVKETNVHSRSKNSSTKGEIGYAAAGVELGKKNGEIEEMRARLSLCDEYAGGPADIAAAENFLSKVHLANDLKMRSLIDSRRNSSNRMLSRELIINMSAETNTTLDVVGKIEFPAFLKSFCEYSRATRTGYEYVLTVLIQF